jgi:O-antigen/teichoic acid export membrane protein
MGSIRKQTIISSLLVYIGFFIGAINTYLYVKQGHFTTEQFALTRIFFDIGQNFYVFASLGVIPIMQKFYPYYKSHLTDNKNDLLTWALVASCIGFILVAISGYLIEPLVVRKFSERSKLIVDYYHFIFPFALGMLFFSVLEGYCWALHKTIVPNFLKETGLRLVTLVFILLYYFNYISFHVFMQLFALLFIIMTLVLAAYLIYLNKLHFTFTKSKLTKRLMSKMLSMQSLIFGGMMIQVLAQTMDSIFIASLKGLAFTGVYTLALYAANFIQVPQRSMQSISTGIISHAWKDKNYKEINRIYQRSSINMLLMSLFIFGCMLLNVKELFAVLHIQDDYTAAIGLITVLGLVRVVDTGTGINGTIIATSTFWKFDFFCGVLLLALRLPLTYIFITKFGAVGAAYSELIGYSIYNIIRFEFLRKKFKMNPFTPKTLYTIIVGVISFYITYLLLKNLNGWTSLLLNTVVFATLFIASTFYFKLTLDGEQLWSKMKLYFKK